jgi:hypothetical protein
VPRHGRATGGVDRRPALGFGVVVPPAVAVLPQPPLLVPELAGSAATETADLRAACVEAARRLAAVTTTWIAVGADAGGRRTAGPDVRGTFAGFGVDVVVGLDPGATAPVDPELPLPLLVAGWAAGPVGARVRGELVAPDLPPEECAALGRALAGEGAGLLVVGDGAATHTEKAPGHLDERAGPFDAAVAAALAPGTPRPWPRSTPTWPRSCGRPAARPGRSSRATAGAAWRAELLHSSAPYGVGYHVAVWTPA